MSKTPQFDWENPNHEVPAAALRLDATAELGERSSDDTKTAPIRLRARTADPIDHWYWGKIAHDLSGYELTGDTSRLALLYDHREPVGYALSKNIRSDNDGLEVSGTLVAPRDSAGPNRAMQLIDQMAGGIPFESSISFAGNLRNGQKPQIQKVPEGETTEVNGRTFDGPGVVVRKWPLRELSVVTSGADSDTESTLLSESDTVSVQFIQAENEDTEMSNSNVTEDPKSVELTSDNDSAEGVADTVTEPVDAQPVELTSGTPADKYFEAFGEQRGSWYFAHGIPFDEAMAQDNKSLRERVELLEGKLDAQASLGHEEALPASEGDVSEPDQFKDKDGSWSEVPVFFKDDKQ